VITVYSKPNCPYCEKAKYLLKSLGLQYEERVVTKDLSVEELYKALGKQVRTIPQIVIDKNHIGGYNELKEYFINEGKINYKGEVI
jgi:glutathione-dependent peroxiredoxin|tara:strand:- start:433 stop:690 length:258 start_codon:yes stop_codon:yes gene_type:complete